MGYFPFGDTHVHSAFSGDSEEEMEVTIGRAISMGMPYLTFTDHMDLDFPDCGVSMIFDPAAYMEKIAELKEKYREKIQIYAGIELGLQPHLSARFRELLHTYPFDFVIGSQHLVNGSDPYYPETFDGKTDEEVYRAYFADVLNSLRSFSDFDTLGHLDYVVRYGRNKAASYSYSAYADQIDEILKLLVEKEIALEINTAGLRQGLGFPNPHPDVLRRYKQLGGKYVTIGSDAHESSVLGSGFEEAKEILKECGFAQITCFSGRNRHFVKF
ncbi:MAG: histidinol-phosphatase HisJ family protein [Lachnospiraceae bacterium]|nr:histidinol-phosphatase HisJ family protein [Lachnospiraceae bacterium]